MSNNQINLALQPKPLPDTIDNASALHNMGAAILDKADDKDSRPLFAQSLEMYHRIFNGKEPLDVAPGCATLAWTRSSSPCTRSIPIQLMGKYQVVYRGVIYRILGALRNLTSRAMWHL